MSGSSICGWMISFAIPLVPGINGSLATMNMITSWCLNISSARKLFMSLIILSLILICSMFISSIMSHCCEWTVDTPMPPLGLHLQYAVIMVNLIFLYRRISYRTIGHNSPHLLLTILPITKRLMMITSWCLQVCVLTSIVLLFLMSGF